MSNISDGTEVKVKAYGFYMRCTMYDGEPWLINKEYNVPVNDNKPQEYWINPIPSSYSYNPENDPTWQKGGLYDAACEIMHRLSRTSLPKGIMSPGGVSIHIYYEYKDRELILKVYNSGDIDIHSILWTVDRNEQHSETISLDHMATFYGKVIWEISDWLLYLEGIER